MADIRIKDLATTATTSASDDYLALDGSTNGTRKILATNVANNVTDVVFGASGPSAKSSIAARAARQGLVFDGTGAATVTLPVIGTGDFAVGAWVKPVAGATSVIFWGANNSLGLAVRATTITIDQPGVGTPLSVAYTASGRWIFVLATRSGTTATIYVDGVSIGSGTVSTNFSAATSQLALLTFPIVIGQPVYLNRALSAAEVVSLYEAGVPAGADYNILPAGNSFSFTGASAFTGYNGITASSVTATSFSASGTATNPFGSGVYGSLQVRSVPGMRYRATWSFTPVSGTAPLVGMGWESNGTWTNTVAASVGSAEFVVTTGANALKFAFITANGNTTSYSVSNITLTPLGLLLAPDAAQSGGGLTWYDTSGNAANITLPATGVTWNVPTSGFIQSPSALKLNPSSGNVLIGTTTDISGTGGLKVAGTSTASSTTSGALQVGSNVGLSGNAGGASYFGGAVTVTGNAYTNGVNADTFDTNAGSSIASFVGIKGSSSSSNTSGIAISNAGLLGFARNAASKDIVSAYLIPSLTVTTSGAEVGRLDINVKPSGNSAYNTNVIRLGGDLSAAFAGAVTVSGGSNTTSAGAVNLTSSSYGGGYTLKDGTKYLGIFSKNSGTQLCFYTNQAAGTDLGSLTPDLIINTGTSTFAGAVAVSSSTASTNTTSGALVVTGGVGVGGALNVGGAVTAGDSGFILNSGGSLLHSSNSVYLSAPTSLVFRTNAATPTPRLTLTDTTATFAGAVAIGNTVNTVSPTSPNRTVTMVIGGVTYYLAAKTTND